MYTVSEVVEIDTAQNLILATVKEMEGLDDIGPEQPFGETDFDQ